MINEIDFKMFLFQCICADLERLNKLNLDLLLQKFEAYLRSKFGNDEIKLREITRIKAIDVIPRLDNNKYYKGYSTSLIFNFSAFLKTFYFDNQSVAKNIQKI